MAITAVQGALQGRILRDTGPGPPQPFLILKPLGLLLTKSTATAAPYHDASAAHDDLAATPMTTVWATPLRFRCVLAADVVGWRNPPL